MIIPEKPEIPYGNLQEIIESAFNGLKIFNILKTSLEMKIFDTLTHEHTLKEVSSKLGMDNLLCFYILETLLKIGLVDKTGDFYQNSKLAEIYLKSDSEYNRTNCILSLEENAGLWNNLDQTLQGNLERKEEAFFPNIIQVMAEDCIAGELQETINLVEKYTEFHDSKSLLDLAGGHGMYSIAFSKINPDIECYVFDLPEVLIETRKYIKKYESNVKTVPGNFYKDDFAGTYDMIFSSYNPGGKNPDIAKKAYESLNLNGLFVNKQYFPENENKTLEEVLDNLEWNFTKFEKSLKGETRYSFKGDLSFQEYLDYLKELGFEVIDVHHIDHLNPSFGTVSRNKMIIAKKVR
ncbi:MAG: hypothetical protein CIT03_01175 [Methanobacterium sp.]|nr:MAG: hypothetical protein CIT03_01175 [Methanobacterium sp.]